MTRAGASGIVKCPRCRQPLPEGARFCLVCGAPVGSPRRANGSKTGAAGPQRLRGRSGSSSADGSHCRLLTLGLLATLVGGVALAAYGVLSAAA